MKKFIFKYNNGKDSVIITKEGVGYVINTRNALNKRFSTPSDVLNAKCLNLSDMDKLRLKAYL